MTGICPAAIGASALKAAGDKSRPYCEHPEQESATVANIVFPLSTFEKDHIEA